MAFPEDILYGSFIPSTQIWDPTSLYGLEIDPEIKEILIRMYQNLGLMATVINGKISGLYPLQEFVTGEQYFSRQNPPIVVELPGGWRYTYFATTLATGATTINLPFTVGTNWLFKSITGAATNVGASLHYPLPFASANGTQNIALWVTNTTIQIVNNSGQSFTGLTIVLEYTKSL